MSRPIQEPSTQRELAGHGWRINQLERRPAPDASITLTQGTTQDIPLFTIGRVANDDVLGTQWELDAAASGGGYVSNENLGPADGDRFSFMVYAGPKNSIWGFHWRYYKGQGFAKHRVYLASLLYEDPTRPSGNPQAKITPYDGGYGTVSYIPLGPAEDAYDPGADAENFHNGQFNFIPGGETNDTLTSLNALGSDPYTGFNISDGGPGWYRLRFIVEGRNASATNWKMRIVVATWRRLDDAGAF